MSTTPAVMAIRGKRQLGEAGKVRILNAQHRCDRCGAQAYIRATLRTPSSTSAAVGQLYFCNHHGREHEAALRPQSTHWLDESRWINRKPTD